MAGALIYDDYDRFCRQAAEHILAILKLSLIHSKRCSLVLSGGTTPGGIYRYLQNHDKEFNWDHVDFFIGDERCVPEDHEDSNYRMIRETFLDGIGCSAKQLYKPDCTLNPDDAAQDYRHRIDAYLHKRGTFDLVLLGMGPDGHTASLFPGYPELTEENYMVVATADEGPLAPGHRRVTLTLPALNKSDHVLFLLKGGPEKRQIMDEVIKTKTPSQSPYPIGRVRPASGKTYWYFSS